MLRRTALVLLVANAANALAPSLSGHNSGSSLGFPTPFDLNSLDGNNGFTITGVEYSSRFGRSITSAGDLNGDGVADLIVGAELADVGDLENAGAVYVIFGTNRTTARALDLDRVTLDGRNGFILRGIAASTGLGRAVSSGGDLNGDGTDDLVVSGSSHDSNRGIAVVIFGSKSSFPSVVDINALDGFGFRVNGEDWNDGLGLGVSLTDDVNGDGLDDLILSSPVRREVAVNSGSVYVIFGSRSEYPVLFQLNALDGTNGFQINGQSWDFLGWGLNVAGDVNGDELADLVLGAWGEDRAYVIFGSKDGFASHLDLNALDGSNGFEIRSNERYDRLGQHVCSGKGDLNGDGVDDIVLGAHASHEHRGGAAYVIFGRREGFPSVVELDELDGQIGFGISAGGTLDDEFGSALTIAGDLNGDGFDDLAVAAYKEDGLHGDGDDQGAVYIIFGTQKEWPRHLNLTALDDSDGFKIPGLAQGDNLGSALSAGDINGDGVSDLAIGAFQDGRGPGRVFVVFGKKRTSQPAATAECQEFRLWNGCARSRCCAEGLVCAEQNFWYAQCLKPGQCETLGYRERGWTCAELLPQLTS